MTKSSALALAAISSVMMLAPGMVQISSAAGSAYEQQKSTAADETFRAYSETGYGNPVAPVRAPVAPRQDYAPSSSATTTVGQDGATKWDPMYPAPRGGREY